MGRLVHGILREKIPERASLRRNRMVVEQEERRAGFRLEVPYRRELLRRRKIRQRGKERPRKQEKQHRHSCQGQKRSALVCRVRIPARERFGAQQRNDNLVEQKTRERQTAFLCQQNEAFHNL